LEGKLFFKEVGLEGVLQKEDIVDRIFLEFATTFPDDFVFHFETTGKEI
jgi:hypothetical protein